MRKKLWVLLTTAVLFVGILGTTTALAADASGSFSSDGVEISIHLDITFKRKNNGSKL